MDNVYEICEIWPFTPEWHFRNQIISTKCTNIRWPLSQYPFRKKPQQYFEQTGCHNSDTEPLALKQLKARDNEIKTNINSTVTMNKWEVSLERWLPFTKFRCKMPQYNTIWHHNDLPSIYSYILSGFPFCTTSTFKDFQEAKYIFSSTISII